MKDESEKIDIDLHAALKKFYELFPRDKTDYKHIGKTVSGFTEQETQEKLKEYNAFVESLRQNKK